MLCSGCCCPPFRRDRSRSYAVETTTTSTSAIGRYTLLGRPRRRPRGILQRCRNLWRHISRPLRRRWRRHRARRGAGRYSSLGAGPLDDIDRFSDTDDDDDDNDDYDGDYDDDDDAAFAGLLGGPAGLGARQPFGVAPGDYTPLQHQTPDASRRHSVAPVPAQLVQPPPLDMRRSSAATSMTKSRSNSHSIHIHTTRIGNAPEKYDTLVDIHIDHQQQQPQHLLQQQQPGDATGTTPSSLASSEAITISSQLAAVSRDAQLMSAAQIQALLAGKSLVPQTSDTVDATVVTDTAQVEGAGP